MLAIVMGIFQSPGCSEPLVCFYACPLLPPLLSEAALAHVSSSSSLPHGTVGSWGSYRHQVFHFGMKGTKII